jgi:hypothetical protein
MWPLALRPSKPIDMRSFIILLLLTCGVLSAQKEDQRVRNIVLVHGAWADGRRRPLKKTWLLRSESSRNKMDRAFSSLTVMGAL